MAISSAKAPLDSVKLRRAAAASAEISSLALGTAAAFRSRAWETWDAWSSIQRRRARSFSFSSIYIVRTEDHLFQSRPCLRVGRKVTQGEYLPSFGAPPLGFLISQLLLFRDAFVDASIGSHKILHLFIRFFLQSYHR